MNLFLTDAGIETTLIFHDGLDLPYFAAFHLLRDREGTDTLQRYFRQHIEIARDAETGFILESPTWRANPDWGEKLGYTPQALAEANRRAINLMHALRAEYETPRIPMVVSGCVGPRGDGYRPDTAMTPDQAAAYHATQIASFADAAVDQVTAITMTNTSEAVGVALAARANDLPVAISFTVETDGRLPTGQPLGEAIQELDDATDRAVAYYMINCAHPSHFERVLAPDGWMGRVRGIRANASRCSHAELDEAEQLDDGDPAELGQQYAALRQRFPWINILGGCCGTDHRHIAQIAVACAA